MTKQKLKRKRFSLAHELGHYVLHHREGKVHVDKTVFFRNDIPNKEDRRMEREANVFASELLMPENLVRKSFSSICSGEILYSQWDQDELPSEMAEQFQVSLSAMVIRLRELRLIPNGF
jgi:Zn-dependent peptidase ImmA (M78 family)